VPHLRRQTLGDITSKVVQGINTLQDPVLQSKIPSPVPEVSFDRYDIGHRWDNRRRQKAYKASQKHFTLMVDKDLLVDRVKHLTDCVLIGRMENVRVTYEALRDWIQEHWYPLLKFTPLFSTLTNGWYIFHFLTVKQREDVEKIPWLIGRGSMVLQRWTPNFNPEHSRLRV